MKIGHNLLAGLINSVWSALIALAAVPFYIKYLGIEAYGLIGFFITTQALLQFLDMGFSTTTNREIARYSAQGKLQEAGKLLHTLAIVYWSMAAIISFLIMVFAPLISKYWLHPRNLSQQTIEHAIMLIGLVIACRWPIALYQGALIGAQRLTISSGINILMVTIGNFGAIIVLAFFSPTVEAFFLWQAFIGLVYAITIRWSAWRVIGRLNNIHFDFYILKNIWRFSVGMSGIGLTALVFTQIDKLILSKLLSLDEFGHYMLATAVVTGIYVLITPMFNVIYPRFSELVVINDIEKLTNLYRLGTRMLVTLLFPLAMMIAVCAQDLVIVWTANPSVASSVAPIITLMVIGSALNGVMYFPYALQLAYGMTWIPLYINIALMCFMAPLIIFLATKYGPYGGALAWLISEIFYLFIGTWITHRYMLKGLTLIWLFQDVGIPLLLSVSIGFLGHYIIQITDLSIYIKLLLGFTLALSNSFLIFWASPKLKVVVWNFIGWEKYAIKT